MSQIVESLNSFPLNNGGFSQSQLKEVRFFKSIQHIPRASEVYDPGICIVAQSCKIGYSGGRVFLEYLLSYL